MQNFLFSYQVLHLRRIWDKRRFLQRPRLVFCQLLYVAFFLQVGNSCVLWDMSSPFVVCGDLVLWLGKGTARNVFGDSSLCRAIVSDKFSALMALCGGTLRVKCLVQLTDDRMKWRVQGQLSSIGISSMASWDINVLWVRLQRALTKNVNGTTGKALSSGQTYQKGQTAMHSCFHWGI